MTTRTLNVPLKGFGAPATDAEVQLAVLDPGDRVKRAAVVFLAFLLVAVILHITASVQLWNQNRAARPIAYAKKNDVPASYAARTMEA